MIKFKYPWNAIGITKYYSSSHKAIDNANAVTVDGVKITNKYAYLPCEAKILKNEKASDYGWFVEYSATDERGTFIMANGHFAKQSTLKVGQTYPMGTIIGEVGSTGNSTAKHDHFRIGLGSKSNALDPTKYLYVYPDQKVHKTDASKVMYYKEDERDKQIELLKKEIDVLNATILEKNKTIEELKAEIEDLGQTIIKANDEIALLKRANESLKEQLEEIKNGYTVLLKLGKIEIIMLKDGA